MAVIRQVTFEGGSLTGPQGFNSTNGSGVALESAAPILGDYSFRINTAVVSNYGVASLGSEYNQMAIALYLRVDDTIGSTNIVRFYRGSTDVAMDIRITSNRTIQAFGLSGPESAPLDLGVVYRVDAIYRNVTPTGTARRYVSVTNMETNATEVVADSSDAVTMTVERIHVGNGRTNVIFDEIHIANDETIPTLPPLPGEVVPVEVELRSGVITGSRLAIAVDRNVPLRSGVTAGSRISIATESLQPVELRSGIVTGSRINVTAVAPTDALVAARAGVIAGSRIAISVEVPVHIRAGVVVGTRPGVAVFSEGAVTLRSGVIVGSRIHIQQEVRVAIRSGVIIGTRHAFQRHRNVAIRSGVIVGARDGYVGPGTGLIVAGQRFSVNALREGDTFRVVLPWAGLSGMTGLAHVNSRTLRDDKHEQDVDLHITPLDTPNVPALAGGARPVAGADQQDYARRLSRSERTQDRIERDRR